MPSFIDYTAGRDGSHSLVLCKDGHSENVPLDLINTYAQNGYSQCTIPTVGSHVEIVVALILAIAVGYITRRLEND